MRKLVEGYLALKTRSGQNQGVTERVNVYEVAGLGLLRTRFQRATGRGYSKFAGRERRCYP